MTAHNTKHIDLNCDMGEGMGHDEELMPFIHSANIACGFHAGNGDTIRRTIDLALAHGVHIGAHPSFRDRENFGRTDMHLPDDKLYTIVLEQLIRIDLVAKERGAVLHHVKPHGALYNMAAKDAHMACIIAQAVKDFREDLVLYGLSGSHLITEAQSIGLSTASEVFADRTYTDEGQLTPRSQPDAFITDEEKSLQQVSQMIGGSVTTASGKVIPIVADTICIHGDGKNAVAFARTIHQLLQKQSIATTA
jgi:UPF0271 protein